MGLWWTQNLLRYHLTADSISRDYSVFWWGKQSKWLTRWPITAISFTPNRLGIFFHITHMSGWLLMYQLLKVRNSSVCWNGNFLVSAHSPKLTMPEPQHPSEMGPFRRYLQPPHCDNSQRTHLHPGWYSGKAFCTGLWAKSTPIGFFTG